MIHQLINDKRFTHVQLGFSELLTNSELGEYRFRVGNYRVIVDVDGETVVVLAVGHRREIYK